MPNSRPGILNPAYRHGHATKGKVTPTYRAWHNMLKRCTNPAHHHFKWYGGRGIGVCNRWYEFEAFLADMGEKPARKTLGRTDNNKDYGPANCQWETAQQQANNKSGSVRVRYKGKRLTLTELSAVTGISYSKLAHRVRRGYPIKDIVRAGNLKSGPKVK